MSCKCVCLCVREGEKERERERNGNKSHSSFCLKYMTLNVMVHTSSCLDVWCMCACVRVLRWCVCVLVCVFVCVCVCACVCSGESTQGGVSTHIGTYDRWGFFPGNILLKTYCSLALSPLLLPPLS